MKMDSNGNIYCGGPKGIEVFSPDGTSIGNISSVRTIIPHRTVPGAMTMGKLFT